MYIQQERLGWCVSNNEMGERVIQRIGEVGRFESDESAVLHVSKSYLRLLEVCKEVLGSMRAQEETPEYLSVPLDTMIKLQKVIKQAEDV